MHLLWGLLMVAIGVLIVSCGASKSDFIICRLLVSRAKLLWGEHVHRFFRVSGAIVILVGVLLALGYIWRAR